MKPSVPLPNTPGSFKPTILIIDDNPANLSVLTDYLDEHGFEILIARDSASGLERAKLAQPDLILLDIQLPDRDGFETCQQLKATPQTEAITVIFISAMGDDVQQKVRGFQAGAVDYLTKPLHEAELLARITTHLSLRNLTRQLQQQTTLLEQEIVAREQAQTELHQYRNQLEILVQTRTSELQKTNEQLRQEITERQRAEVALRKSETQLQLALEAANMGIWVWDIKTAKITWSDNVEYIFGLEPGSFSGTYEAYMELVYPDDRPILEQKIQEAMEHYREYHVEHRIIGADEHIRWVEGKGQIFYSESGQPIRMIGAVQDITERRRVEAALRESEDLLRRSQSVAQIGSYYLDTRTGQWISSPALDDIFGIDDSFPKDVTGWISIVHPEYRDEMLQYLTQYVLAEHRRFEKDYRIIRHSDQQERWVYGLGELEFDDNDQPIKMIGTIQDITVQKQAQKSLKTSEERYALVVKGANDGIWDWDLTTDQAYFSPRYKEILGYTDEEFPNEAEEWRKRIHPDDVEDVLQANQACIEGTVDHFAVEYRMQHKDGSYHWILGRGANLKDQNGQVCRLAGTHADITERKRTEAELRTSETRYRALVESQIDLISRYLPDTTLTFVNDAYCHFYGKTREELIGLSFLTMVAPEFHEPALRETENFLKDPTPIAGEYLNYTWDGQARWIHWIIQGIVDENGQTVELQATGRDITPLKQAEQALRESETQLSLIFNSTSDMQALLRIEPDGRLVAQASNRAYETTIQQLLSVDSLNITGRDRAEYLREFGLTPEMIEAETALYRQAIESRSSVQYNMELPAPGGYIALEISLEPVLDTERHCTHVLWNGRDVTARKQAEEQLKASLQEKEVLLKEIHHRVKNNMQVISSLLDLQASNVKDTQVQELFKESRNRIKSMALIHERLYQSQDLAHINFAEYLQNLVNYIRQSYGARAAAINIQITADPILLGVETAIPCGLIINELLSNVFKHAFPGNQAGTVWIELHADSERGMSLVVRDNGIGLPPDVDFQRAKSLGLTIVSTLVKQLKGHIEVRRHAGTEYCITFAEPVA